MKLRELPGFPKIYLDFVERSPSLQPRFPHAGLFEVMAASASALRGRNPNDAGQRKRLLSEKFLGSNGERAKQNIRLLAQDAAVVVAASIRPGLAGGPLSNLLKCLTLARLADELGSRGIPTVPLCWIESTACDGAPADPIRLIDAGFQLREIPSPAGTASIKIESDFAERLISTLSEFPGGDARAEWMQIIRESYLPGTKPTHASASCLSRILAPWGVLFFDPLDPISRAFSADTVTTFGDDIGKVISGLDRKGEELRALGYPINAGATGESQRHQEAAKFRLSLESLFPIVGHVVDEAEIYDFALIRPAPFPGTTPEPALWPRVSATVIDVRSQKILDRYGLELTDLLAPGEELLGRLVGGADVENTAAMLRKLTVDIETAMVKLKGVPSPASTLPRALEDASRKMVFQMGKLQERFLAANLARREVIQRQIGRAQVALAPEGGLQERSLSGLHFLARYSAEFPRFLCEKIEISNPEHQLISVE